MSKVKIFFCLFLFLLSFFYLSNYINKVDILKLILNNEKKEVFFDIAINNHLNLPLDYNIKDKDLFDKEKIMISSKMDNDEKCPLIYIFNTHETEEYSGSFYNIVPTVKTVSDILMDELNTLGVCSITEKRSITKEVKKRKLDYTGTYEVSFDYLKEMKKANSALEYFFDIHRDSITGNMSRVTINNKKYAKLMFLIGTKNSNYKKNEKNIKIMQEYLNKYYPGLVRPIYYQSHSGFNQFYSERMFLVEIGGPDNTLEEIYNTSVALSRSIKYFVEETYEK